MAGRERAVIGGDEAAGGRSVEPAPAGRAADDAGDRHAVAFRRAAVLGSPIVHSLSPVLHRAAYRDLGLDWRYDAVEVTESGLAGFVAGCGPEWVGLSLTMPLKRAVLPLLATRAPLVEVVGAANTVVFGADRRLAGHNTDVAGMVLALRGIGVQAGPAVVLGGGATAASALAALAELGCREVRLLARRPEVAGHELAGVADRVGIQLAVGPWPQPGQRLPDADDAPIVVSTAPASAGPSLVAAVPARPGWLLDVSYDPWPTVLVQAWEQAGGRAVAGDEMLLHQAVAQVELMVGRAPSTAAMRAALRSAIQAR